MEIEDKKVSKIEDKRLNGYVKRTRSGSEQVFYKGNDERDFERYRAEGGTSSHDVVMHDKSDTIRIQPPERNYYAELINNEWWWLDGCNQCNGRPRNGHTYMGECEKHNVCRTCGTHHNQVKGTVWGGFDGWQCNQCQEIEHEHEKQLALSAMPEEYDSWDFNGVTEITCPYCAYEFSDSWERSNADNEDHECHRCDNTFKVTAVHSLTFDCDRVDA